MSIPANGAVMDARHQDMQAEIDRLRAALLEAEQRVCKLEEQRDDYRAVALLWMREHCSDADMVDFNADEFTVTIDEMIARAETMLKA